MASRRAKLKKKKKKKKNVSKGTNLSSCSQNLKVVGLDSPNEKIQSIPYQCTAFRWLFP